MLPKWFCNTLVKKVLGNVRHSGGPWAQAALDATEQRFLPDSGRIPLSSALWQGHCPAAVARSGETPEMHPRACGNRGRQVLPYGKCRTWPNCSVRRWTTLNKLYYTAGQADMQCRAGAILRRFSGAMPLRLGGATSPAFQRLNGFCGKSFRTLRYVGR